MQGIKLIDLPKEHEKYALLLQNSIQEVVLEGKYINGPQVASFCDSLSHYLNIPHVIPCANGTDALQIALMALELQQGDEVIIPSFNYVAAVETVVLLGLTPVFVDVDPLSFNLSVNDLEQKITPKTKAIIVVHLFGLSAEMNKILNLAKTHHLRVIEDNAQSFGSEFSGKKLGTLGDIGTTSFFPTKNLGCMGDGGAIFCHDELLAHKLKAIASHGQKERYLFDYVGINSRLDTLQAAILAIKLRYLDENIEKKRSISERYFLGLESNEDIVLPTKNVDGNHSYNQFTIQVNNRDEIRKKLLEKGVPTMVYYPKPLHQQPAYSKYFTSPLPVSEQLCETVLSLPIHPVLSEQEQAYIIKTLKEVV